jgi:hypothetical protein
MLNKTDLSNILTTERSKDQIILFIRNKIGQMCPFHQQLSVCIDLTNYNLLIWCFLDFIRCSIEQSLIWYQNTVISLYITNFMKKIEFLVISG